MADTKTPAEIITEKFDTLKVDLDTKFASKEAAFTETVKTAVMVEVTAALEAAKANPGMSKDEANDLIKKVNETVTGFDEFQKKYRPDQIIKMDKTLSLSEAVEAKLKEMGIEDLGTAGSKIEGIEKELKSMSGIVKIPLGKVDLKAQGSDMTTANSLTGDPQRTYNNRQGIIPAQKINFRDLMNSIDSPTGTLVTYIEDSTETNNITTQTEGSTKGQNQYTLTEKVNVQNYIAGFSVFSKQLLRNLPFLQGTLPRMLLRDFYKAENSIFYTAVSGAATGPTSMGSSPDDVKQIIALIGYFLATDYTASYIVVNPVLMARLITSTYTNGYYSGAGSVTLNGANSAAPITISGVPVFQASWVPAAKALLVDMDYLERIETEGLSIAFSYEDSTNFRQNKVTARIECQESVNLMMGNAASFVDLGAS